MKNSATDLEFRRIQADILLDIQRIRHVTERRIGALLEEHDLDTTPAQANVLMTLIQNREPMTARQLARNMQLSEVTIGRFVRSMEATGWVSRERNPTDSRSILVQPTPKARAALPRFIQVSNALQDAAFTGLNPDSIAKIAFTTRRILMNLSEPAAGGSDAEASTVPTSSPKAPKVVEDLADRFSGNGNDLVIEGGSYRKKRKPGLS